jgi:hypothetical protein
MADSRIRLVDSPRLEDVPPSVEELLHALGGPTLIRVDGRDRSRTRVVATLIHGNEPSGVRGVHAWLRAGETPAVNAVFFIASVVAALEAPGFAHRALPGARDLNRCFVPEGGGEEGELAREALGRLRAYQPEALIDLHNTTGHTPPYAVGPTLGPRELALVSLFADRFVHSRLRLGALVEATCDEIPSVTIECGRAGNPAADAVALAGLERFLQRERLGDRRSDGPAVSVLVDPVRVRARPGARLAFGDRPEVGADLTMAGDVDRHNFEALLPGVLIGWVGSDDAWPVEAFGADGNDVSRDFFVVSDGVLRTRRGMIPIMMTVDPGIAESDCLFYMVHEPPGHREQRSPEL